MAHAVMAGAGADPACAPTLFAIAPNAPPRPRSLCLVGRRVRPLRDEDEVEAKACLHRPLHLHEGRVPAHLEAGRGEVASLPDAGAGAAAEAFPLVGALLRTSTSREKGDKKRETKGAIAWGRGGE